MVKMLNLGNFIYPSIHLFIIDLSIHPFTSSIMSYLCIYHLFLNVYK